MKTFSWINSLEIPQLKIPLIYKAGESKLGCPMKTTPLIFMKTSWLLFLCTTFLVSCAAVNHGEDYRVDKGEVVAQLANQKARLVADLDTMLGVQDPESSILAEKIVSCIVRLSKEYDIQTTASVHNFFIHLGIKERGLCCHWTQDLYRVLLELNLAKYEFMWGVSKHGSLREHNSLVVVGAGKPFKSGIVIDPWRFAGAVFWSKVSSDEYSWQVHPHDDGTGSIQCENDS